MNVGNIVSNMSKGPQQHITILDPPHMPVPSLLSCEVRLFVKTKEMKI